MKVFVVVCVGLVNRLMDACPRLHSSMKAIGGSGGLTMAMQGVEQFVLLEQVAQQIDGESWYALWS